MGRVELPGGVCATDSEALTALAAAAKKRGISYGNLIASTSGWEQDEIIRDYCASKRRNRRKK